jgi:hypothetical protein
MISIWCNELPAISLIFPQTKRRKAKLEPASQYIMKDWKRDLNIDMAGRLAASQCIKFYAFTYKTTFKSPPTIVTDVETDKHFDALMPRDPDSWFLRPSEGAVDASEADEEDFDAYFASFEQESQASSASPLSDGFLPSSP